MPDLDLAPANLPRDTQQYIYFQHILKFDFSWNSLNFEVQWQNQLLHSFVWESSFWWFPCSFIHFVADPEHENQPFDFLIDGELIRMPLDQFLMAKGISAVRYTIPTFQFYFSSIAIRMTDKLFTLMASLICRTTFLFCFGGIAGESTWDRVCESSGS